MRKSEYVELGKNQILQGFDLTSDKLEKIGKIQQFKRKFNKQEQEQTMIGINKIDVYNQILEQFKSAFIVEFLEWVKGRMGEQKSNTIQQHLNSNNSITFIEKVLNHLEITSKSDLEKIYVFLLGVIELDMQASKTEQSSNAAASEPMQSIQNENIVEQKIQFVNSIKKRLLESYVLPSLKQGKSLKQIEKGLNIIVESASEQLKTLEDSSKQTFKQMFQNISTANPKEKISVKSEIPNDFLSKNDIEEEKLIDINNVKVEENDQKSKEVSVSISNEFENLELNKPNEVIKDKDLLEIASKNIKKQTPKS